MFRTITFLFIFCFTLANTSVLAQSKNKIPCTTKEYKQFNFWVGNWNVYDTKGKLIGTNHVKKMSNACTIQENWSSKVGPSKGTSYNYYDKNDGSWNQLWIDNAGGNLKLKGKLVGKNMVLKSDLVKNSKGNYYNQITFFNNSDGTVTQVWELLDENNTVFNEIFRGIYKRNTK